MQGNRHPPKRRRRPGARGFTLAELAVAVSIVGVALTLAVPDVTRIVRRERALSEASKVAAAFERARNRSRVNSCRTVVTVNAAAGTVVLAADPGDADTACRALAGRTFAIDKDLVTLGALTVGGSARSSLTIDASGGFSGSARAVLPVTLAVAGVRRVEMWPAIGTVRLTQ